MLHTDFLLTTQIRIQACSSFDEIIEEFEYLEHWVGGNIFTPEQIVRLGALLLNTPVSALPEIALPFPTTARLYAIEPQLINAILQCTTEGLLNVAVQWSDTLEWSNVNSFDIAGFLVDFRGLCKEAIRKQQSVYLLVAPDQEWVPNTT
jgi:hypothetical protein